MDTQFISTDLELSLSKFIEFESEQFYNNTGQIIVDNLINHVTDVEHLKSYWLNSFVEVGKRKIYFSSCFLKYTVVSLEEHKIFAAPETISNDDVFREAYQSLLTSNSETVRKLLIKEKSFAEDVQKLIRARDWEVERMKQEYCIIN